MSDFQLFPEQASSVAWQVDGLYFLLIGLTVLFSIIVFGLVGFFAIKYRRRSPDEMPKQNHGSLPMELAWTIIPLFMAIGVFTVGADVFFRLTRTPADPMEVYVVGKQWMWKIQHEEGKREINTLHVPLNQTVRLTMTSEDVIHDFFIPAFRVKNDVIPGRYTTLWFEATKLGEYHIFCAEYCGTQHSGMIGKVVVLDPTDYDNWLSDGAGVGTMETPVQAGARHFEELSCQTCHKQTSGGRGPTLLGLYNRTERLTNGQEIQVDDNYVRDSILNPHAQIVEGYTPIMPIFQGQINEETLLQLIAYIKSLSEESE
jgi:cytochrome c oxidase subunit II